MIIGATSKDVTSDDSIAFARAMGIKSYSRVRWRDPWRA